MSSPAFSAARKLAALDIDPTDLGTDEGNEAVGRAALSVFVSQLTPEELAALQAVIDLPFEVEGVTVSRVMVVK